MGALGRPARPWVPLLAALLLAHGVVGYGSCGLKRIEPPGGWASLDPHWHIMAPSFSQLCGKIFIQVDCEAFSRVNHGLPGLPAVKPCMWIDYPCRPGYKKLDRNHGGTGRVHTQLKDCEMQTTAWNEDYWCCQNAAHAYDAQGSPICRVQDEIPRADFPDDVNAQVSAAMLADELPMNVVLNGKKLQIKAVRGANYIIPVAERPAYSKRDKEAYQHRGYSCREQRNVVVSGRMYPEMWCCRDPAADVGKLLFTEAPTSHPTAQPTPKPVRTVLVLPECEDDPTFAVREWHPYTYCQNYFNKDPFVGEHQYCLLDVGYGDDGEKRPSTEACPVACETCYQKVGWDTVSNRGGRHCPIDSTLEEVYADTEDAAKNACMKWHTPKVVGGAGKCAAYTWASSGAGKGFTQICEVQPQYEDFVDWNSGSPRSENQELVEVPGDPTVAPSREPTTSPTRFPTGAPTGVATDAPSPAPSPQPVAGPGPADDLCPDTKKDRLCVCESVDCPWGAKTCTFTPGASPQCHRTPEDECNVVTKKKSCTGNGNDIICAWDAKSSYCEKLDDPCNVYSKKRTCDKTTDPCQWDKNSSKCVEGPVKTCDMMKKKKLCKALPGCKYAKKANTRPAGAPACYDPKLY